jgi:hypothetical protein
MEMEIECRPLPGTNILDAAREARRISHTLGVLVTFDFNGISVVINSSTDPEKVVATYEKANEEKRSCAIIV